LDLYDDVLQESGKGSTEENVGALSDQNEPSKTTSTSSIVDDYNYEDEVNATPTLKISNLQWVRFIRHI